MALSIKVHENNKDGLNEALICEMATANLKDFFKDFSCGTYKVVIKGPPKEHFFDNKAHVHIYHTQDGWEIRMSMEGEYISAVKFGNRGKNDTFSDIEKVFRKWLVRKSVSYPEITNYVHIQRMWNEINPDKEIEVKPTLELV